MILYKYISRKWAPEVINNEELAFSSPLVFNDPFELTAAPVSPPYQSENLLAQSLQFQTASSTLFDAALMSEQVMNRGRLGLSCVALCLTKTPRNPLMWAHYGKNQGIVVGLDVSASFFTGFHNVCPVQYGSIIYKSTKPPALLEDQLDDGWYQKGFKAEHLSKIQRAFLYKAQYWSYEDEVRVVKHVDEPTEEGIRRKSKDKNPLAPYLYRIPPNTIREVHFVKSQAWLYHFKLHTKQQVSGNQFSTARQTFEQLTRRNIQTFVLVPSKDSWELESCEIRFSDLPPIHRKDECGGALRG